MSYRLQITDHGPGHVAAIRLITKTRPLVFEHYVRDLDTHKLHIDYPEGSDQALKDLAEISRIEDISVSLVAGLANPAASGPGGGAKFTMAAIAPFATLMTPRVASALHHLYGAASAKAFEAMANLHGALHSLEHLAMTGFGFIVFGTLQFLQYGEQQALKFITNKATTPENLVYKLFTNNHTPASSDDSTNYTEASGFGYASITLTGASWGSPSGNGPATIAYAQQTWTFTGALGNVYGYWADGATSGTGSGLGWLAEKFSNGPYNIQNNGDQIKLTPTITGS